MIGSPFRAILTGDAEGARRRGQITRMRSPMGRLETLAELNQCLPDSTPRPTQPTWLARFHGAGKALDVGLVNQFVLVRDGVLEGDDWVLHGHDRCSSTRSNCRDPICR